LSIASSDITIAGAGSVGCYVGGCLALAGRGVTLLGRPDLMHAIALNGLRITDRDGRDDVLRPGSIATTTDPASALTDAGVIVVTVKCADTAGIGRLVRQHAPSAVTVVSYQNGTTNSETLQRELGTRARVVAGMVPFNVLQTREAGDVPRMHRATSGRIHIAAGTPGLVKQLSVPGARVVAHADMTGIAWGKLVMNLNNALNALSGLPLQAQLDDRRWRLILAAQAEEALAVLRASGLKAARVDRTNPGLIAFGMRLPAGLFKLAALAMPSIDAQARSSMWEDLERRRPTEIDYLQGAILDLAAKSATPAPLTRRIRDLVRSAESARLGSPRLAPEEVAGGLVRLA
jgi:2-dehydropantoate 2-reductase